MTFIYKYTISPYALKLVSGISSQVGRFDLSLIIYEPLKLRKETLAKTIHDTAAIEGNTLSLREVTEVIEGKKIRGPRKDIMEIENLHTLYKNIEDYNPLNRKDFLRAHKTLMKGLVKKHGVREIDVGILGDGKLKYKAPSFVEVEGLLEKMFEFDFSLYPPLVASSIFHHMIETIHPFVDGNGRIGRFWQSLYLYKFQSTTFSILPIESLVKKSVKSYYEALSKAREKKDYSYFVEYMLKTIKNCVDEYSSVLSKKEGDKFDARVEKVKKAFGDILFSRKQYMSINDTISSATASNDLIRAVKESKVNKVGRGNQTRYKFN